ncbi:hypothetical protein M501DRAFT_998233 [Patellaria atrata CBS 101060]|uniref:Tat pathway signal sequence n=1 Tax=Patellaria atrata CBS 101060 TaxID=1346257 RepID=A0A9P4SFM0_9PEZI|nr:hypothetical protein M501DRAFT_998233 [Patellaria atrata CBS 101060]
MGKHIEQSLPLLEDDDSLSDAPFEEKASRGRLPMRQFSKAIISLLVYSFLMTGTVVYLGLKTWKASPPYTPARDFVEFETRQAVANPYSIYSEEPSPEVDDAWNKLVSPIYFQATRDEIKLSNDDPDASVRLVDGGYFTSFGVYHELHCLRRLYWHLNEEHYFPNRTAHRRRVEVAHAAHCLGVVLHNVMCTPNTALYTFGFNPETDKMPELKTSAQRQCIKWEPFHEWATSRSVGYDPAILAPEILMAELHV